MNNGELGVHINHCCEKHGCKYGDDGCPVTLGFYEQVGPCCDCDDYGDEEMVMDRSKTTAECAADLTKAICVLINTVIEEYKFRNKK